jgi:hypothetical protein
MYRHQLHTNTNPNGGLNLQQINPNNIIPCFQEPELAIKTDTCVEWVQRWLYYGLAPLPTCARLFHPVWEQNFIPNNIRQGHLGDCWLLAALVALANTPEGQNHIYNMIADTGTHIVVRLFRKEINGSYTPVFFKMNRTIPAVYSSCVFGIPQFIYGTHKNNIYWASFIEKAMVFMASLNQTSAQISAPSYKKIVGGETLSRIDEIIGTPISKSYIIKPPTFLDNPIAVLDSFITESTNIDAFFDSYPQIFTDKAEAQECSDFITNNPKDPEKVLSKDRSLHSLKKLGAYFDGLNPQIKTKILNYFTAQFYTYKKCIPGYSSSELMKFNMLKSLLSNHCVITSGTIYDIIVAKNLIPRSPAKGLVKSHAYAVLGVEGDPSKNEPLFVILANPWGFYGKDYKNVDGNFHGFATTTTNGTFRLCLHEFCTSFDSIWHSLVPIPPAPPVRRGRV